MANQPFATVHDSWIYAGGAAGASGANGKGGVAGVLAVHAALLPIGSGCSILYYAGDQWLEPKVWESVEIQPNPNADPRFKTGFLEIDHTRLFDCANFAVHNPGSPFDDIFCSGHAFLPDGRLVVVGGTQHFSEDSKDLHHAHWSGLLHTWIFNHKNYPKTAAWTRGPMLNRDPDQGNTGGGRWYPSVITLSNGSVFTNTGHPVIWEFTSTKLDATEELNADGRHNNTKPEIIDPTGRTCKLINKQLGVSGAHDFAVFYPRMFVMPHTGNIFVAQPLYSSKVHYGRDIETTGTWNHQDDDQIPYQNVKDNSFFYNAFTQTVSGGFLGPNQDSLDPQYLNAGFTSQQTSGVLLPLHHEENYKARVLLTGCFKSVIVELDETNPQSNKWRETAPRQLQDPKTNTPPFRNFCNTTLLPTGVAVVTGGVRLPSYSESPTDFVSGGVKHVEIYHPPHLTSPDRWSVGAEAREVRGYHSTALLMPDGRIWTAGSEIENFVPKTPPNPSPALPKLAIEIYEPDYYSQPNRISIISGPEKVSYNSTFSIVVSHHQHAGVIQTTRVAFMRFGSSTHSFDGDQRYVSLPFTRNNRGAPGTAAFFQEDVHVTAPPDGTVAPPGYYMLWAMGSDGAPAVKAWIVQLGFERIVVGPPIRAPWISSHPRVGHDVAAASGDNGAEAGIFSEDTSADGAGVVGRDAEEHHREQADTILRGLKKEDIPESYVGWWRRGQKRPHGRPLTRPSSTT